MAKLPRTTRASLEWIYWRPSACCFAADSSGVCSGPKAIPALEVAVHSFCPAVLSSVAKDFAKFDFASSASDSYPVVAAPAASVPSAASAVYALFPGISLPVEAAAPLALAVLAARYA